MQSAEPPKIGNKGGHAPLCPPYKAYFFASFACFARQILASLISENVYYIGE